MLDAVPAPRALSYEKRIRSMTPTQPIRAGRSRFVVAALTTLTLALAACSGANPSASPSASGANGPQTIHLTLRPGNDSYVSVRSVTGCTNTTSCQGDYLIGDDLLFDAATGKQVGTLVYVEFVVDTGDTLFHSPANTITLNGRGQIVFSETLYDDGSGRPATAAIIGGTDEFLGVTGFVISRSLSGRGDFVITINN